MGDAPRNPTILEFLEMLSEASPIDDLKSGLAQLLEWIQQLEGQVQNKNTLTELERGKYLGELSQMRSSINLLVPKGSAMQLVYKAPWFWKKPDTAHWSANTRDR